MLCPPWASRTDASRSATSRIAVYQLIGAEEGY